MAQPTKGEKGYKTPPEAYPQQDNQQSGEDIATGADQQDQLEHLQENAPEDGREGARKAGAPPISDDDVNNGQ